MKNLKIIWSVRSECGPEREKNEDAVYPDIGGSDTPPFKAAVCDGLGGHAKGEVASKIATSTMENAENNIKKIIQDANIKITESLFNGLEKSAFLVFDELNEIKNKLSELGLPNISMSGAGPSFFSIIDNENQGMNYLEKVKRNIDCKCFLVNLL